MKNILTESTKSKFKVLEHKPANVLKRIQGVLSDFKSNRNGRIYPRELWENVLNSDYVKEMIESHGLVGELDHPEERLEISLQNVSHVINDMWIEGDQVLGTIDILPTPSGKIVSELIDYGTDIGISSRGAGSVGPNNVVDPDYQFVTFDFVARPSCEAARLNMIVESVQPEIDTNSDDKVKNILEGYKTSLKEDIFKNYYNKLALPAPGEEELYGYDLSEVCDNVEKYFGLKNKREALNKIVEEHLDKKVIDEVMKYSNLKESKPVDFEYIGRDDWGRHIIKSKDTGTYFGDVNLTKAGKERDLSRASWHTYSGNDPYEGEPEASMKDDIIVNIVNPEKIPTDYQRNEYELLYRLKSDCDYFLGNGDGFEGHLWAGSVDKQIAKMRELYNQLEEKPEWLTSEDIDRYEEEMKNYKAGSKHKKYQVIMTLQKSPGNYETRVQGIYDSAEQASDICGELRAQGIGATYQEMNESVKLNEGLKTIYNIDVDWLNDLRKEYESGNISESELQDIIEGYVTGTLNIKYEKDPDAWIGATTFAFKNITKDFTVNESTILEYGDDPYYANQENDRLNREISNTRAKYKDAFRTIYSLACGMGNILLWDSPAERKLEKLTEEINKLKDLSKKYKDGNIEESMILEAAMSDQEVYKVVLGWYKQQIESGKMTLNQCYELLSDKAKVSLNKMVDQSKIRESLINGTIQKLIKESVALNEGYDLEAIEDIVRDHLDEDYRAIENGVEMEDWYYDFVMNNTDEDIEAIVNILKDKEKITNNLIDEVIRDYVKGN